MTIGLEFSFEVENLERTGMTHPQNHLKYTSMSFTNIHKGALLVLNNYKLKPIYNKKYMLSGGVLYSAIMIMIYL